MENLKIYEDAVTYFNTHKSIFSIMETRNDIVKRLAYIEYFIDLEGKTKESDDYCCNIEYEDLIDNYLILLYAATVYQMRQHMGTWNCDKQIFLNKFKDTKQVIEWIISGRCLKCQKKSFEYKNVKDLQGKIIGENISCCYVKGYNPMMCYDIFFTYMTRVISEQQITICNDTKCPCYIEDKKHHHKFEIDLKSYRHMMLNSDCPCGSKKKYKKCCLNDLDDPELNTLSEKPTENKKTQIILFDK